MKYDRDINNIRLLLDRYYRAETSPDEEQLLETFFKETNPADIPYDMEADAKLFELMSDTHLRPVECDIPTDLIEKINGIMDAPSSSTFEKWSKGIFRILRYSGVAAAACIVLVLIILNPIGLHQGPNLSENINEEDMKGYNLSAEAEANDNVLTIVKSQADKYAIVDDKTNEPTEAPQVQTNESDGFIEITDPEEARKIALSIRKLLAQNADRTNEALEQIGNSIDSYKELTKSILQ